MRWIAAVLLCLLFAGCGNARIGIAQAAADRTTKAVYADDFDAVTDSFDAALKPTVSRTEVGLLSDKLHALGAYRGLTYVDGDPVKDEYTYRATFDKGAASLVVRLDRNGNLAAYRVFPQS